MGPTRIILSLVDCDTESTTRAMILINTSFQRDRGPRGFLTEGSFKGEGRVVFGDLSEMEAALDAEQQTDLGDHGACASPTQIQLIYGAICDGNLKTSTEDEFRASGVVKHDFKRAISRSMPYELLCDQVPA